MQRLPGREKFPEHSTVYRASPQCHLQEGDKVLHVQMVARCPTLARTSVREIRVSADHQAPPSFQPLTEVQRRHATSTAAEGSEPAAQSLCHGNLPLQELLRGR